MSFVKILDQQLYIKDEYNDCIFRLVYDSYAHSSIFLVRKFVVDGQSEHLNRNFRWIFLFNTHKHNVRSLYDVVCTKLHHSQFFIFHSLTRTHSSCFLLARLNHSLQMFNNTKIKRKKKKTFFPSIVASRVKLRLLNNTI